MPSGELIEQISHVALFRNSGLELSTASVQLPGYTAFNRYIQHVLAYAVDQPYSCNNWSLNELIDELNNKQPARARKCHGPKYRINAIYRPSRSPLKL